MGLNISLFVHGVPMGQKIWGPKGDDQNYMSSFYGPRWDSPEVMKVEVMTFGGVTNCYYSFVKGQNVCDSQGRAGSYFALTLRINAFYVDLQNIYNILKAAYEKMCVGLCVQDTGAMVKYLVADFQSIDSKLKDIENHIVNYISKFSVNEDIVSLSGFPAISQGASLNVNLHECSKAVALDCVKKGGKMMVSPYFLPANAAKTVDRYKTEMEVVRQKSQDEIQTVTQQAEAKLRLRERRSQQQIAQANAENERKMQELRQNYSEVDEKLDALHRRNRGLENEVADWKNQYKQKDKELQSSNVKIQKLQEFVEKLQRKNSSSEDCGVDKPGDPNKITLGKKQFVVGVALFFVILLIVLLVYLLMGNCSVEKKIEVLLEKVESLEKQKHTKKNGCGNESLEGFNISIKKSGNEVDEVECGETYVISLNGKGTDVLYGEFEGAAFDLKTPGHLTAKRDSAGKTCTIRYVYEGQTLATKSIKIKNKKGQKRNKYEMPGIHDNIGWNFTCFMPAKEEAAFIL